MPFPRVAQTKEQALALREEIDRYPYVNWPVVLTPGRKRVSAPWQRRIMREIARATDGAGRARLEVSTIARGSCSSRTVERATLALEEQRLLEPRIPLRRLSGDKGQGSNVYRVGPELRVAAGLKEVAWTPDPDLLLPVNPPDTPAVSPLASPPDTPPAKEATVSPPCVGPSAPTKSLHLPPDTEGAVSPHERRTETTTSGDGSVLTPETVVEDSRAYAGAREEPLPRESWPDLAGELVAAGHPQEAEIVLALMEAFPGRPVEAGPPQRREHEQPHLDDLSPPRDYLRSRWPDQ